MRDLAEAIALIKKWEGFRSKAYLDPVGIPTIGYGTIRWPSGRGVRLGDTISEPQAAHLLEKHIEKHILHDLNKALKVPVNNNQYNALVSFTYNLGIGNLRKSTLLKKINLGDYQGAAREFNRWVYAGGKKLRGLVNRRKEERALFERPINLPSNPTQEPKKGLWESIKQFFLSLFSLFK